MTQKRAQSDHRRKFTQLFVDKIAPPAKGRVDYFDTQLPGFCLRVSAGTPKRPGGHKSWSVVARLAGKQRRFAVGTLELYSKVEEARERAKEILQEIAKGADPTAVVNTATRPVDTVKAVCGSFITRYAKPKNRSWKGTEALLKNHLLPTLGERDVRSVTRADLRDLLDGLTDQGMGTGVNRVLATVRKVFGWAVERDYVEKSPADGIKAPASEVDRDRWLSEAELVRVWRAAEALGAYPSGFIRTLLLTGQRRSEVAAMRWDEIDLDKNVWTLPREKAKNDEEHDVPLSPQALAALDALPRTTSAFVFPGRRSYRKGQAVDVPMSGFSKMKVALDKKVEKPTEDAEPMTMRAWRLHDLRRTAGTHMSKLGVASGTISRVMNHAEGGVTKRYVRHGFLDEKRAALDRWGAHVQRLLDPAADNVVTLRAAG